MKPVINYVHKMVALSVVENPYKSTRRLAKELPFNAKSICTDLGDKIESPTFLLCFNDYRLCVSDLIITSCTVLS